MFKARNVLIAVGVSALLAACGGGSDSPTVAAGGSGTGTNTAAPADALRGSLTNVGDQVRFSESDITTEQLSTIALGAGPFPKGVNAPLTNFGFRISPNNMAGTAAQTKTASFAIDLTERAASAGTGQAAEVLQVLVDKVSVTATADGNFSIADVTGSKVYVYFKPATGTAVNASASATGLVHIVPVAGDTTSSFLVLDVDTAVTRAITDATTLGKMKTAAGLFDFKSVFSNVAMTKGDGTTAMIAPALSVTNSGQTTATGGGATGAVQVE